MRVFNESKKYELTNYDLEKGYLKNDSRFVKHHPSVPATEEKGHYEVLKTYDNGGTDVEWIVDVPASPYQEPYDEYEDILVFFPYTQTELAENEIKTLKRNLADTDYQAIKFAEGAISEEEYAPIKAQREDWRYRINYLQSYYNI